MASDEITGYPGDISVSNNGIKEAAEVIRVLEDAQVPCCMVAEPALIYYGTGRVMTAVHMPCTPETIEYSHNRIPYPKLPVYTQSLLDTLNLVDLDDLVDGMNLTYEWGDENLDLDRGPDANWGRWRADFLSEGAKAEDEEIPQWCFNPPSLRTIWRKAVSAEAKRNRQSWKYMPHMETRFRKYGQQDPRLRPRAYC
ncbi:predicted protein [Uncinocarpus reesii 1704]|uniref:Uncharacterized protein n=1 Tax=Uncinocarpus reesii (strain UAMH 1704) TaxID=336963 RepID=C4JNJ6_UNCRE|nr:uncharacterized protein UREG_02994 [Uncinocarpus reesii 1704]EEP78149.1 predicted protein [Uncinocarpus reesii 1704]